MLCEYDHDHVVDKWDHIWKLQVAERIKYFMWLVQHNRLLTNSTKAKMNLGHAMCNFCRNMEETILHALRDCALVKQMWLSIIPFKARSSFFGGDLEQWVQYNLRRNIKGLNGIRWEDFWATTCHCLWIWRNRELHEENYNRPMQPVLYIMQRLREYYQASKVSGTVVSVPKRVSWIRWQPPEEGWVKVNSDGASKGEQMAGCGGLIRDHRGHWLGGFAKFVGVGSAFVAELWGVLEGLKYAKRKGYRKIDLNIDSVAVMKVIKSGKTNSSLGTSLVKSIKKLLDEDWEVKISHSYREANRSADALTSMGCTLNYNIVYFETCSINIRELIHADVLGISTPRLISL
ncbi:unnamed protein product [Trifolium pratense]|uniref:Uncharacterized protein n=1 Tax=Trifolium pratense TaxID=57577 RepID=A0ACB0LY79_TRIPR|nr:unnamed protein product [Trifolium pratense]